MVHVLHRHIAPERAQPGVEVGDVGVGEVAGELADEPLGRDPEEAQGAFLGAPRPDDVVVAVELFDHHRDLVVRVRHVDVGPHDDPSPSRRGARAPRRSRAAVVGVADEVDPVDRRQVDLGAVVGTVIDDDDLERVRRGGQRVADAVDLGAQVPAFVVDRQHHADVELIDRLHAANIPARARVAGTASVIRRTGQA